MIILTVTCTITSSCHPLSQCACCIVAHLLQVLSEQHVLHGRKCLAQGTTAQLQLLARTLLLHCLNHSQQLPNGQPAILDCNPSTLQWWYLGAGGVQMGPFSATHLQQFVSSQVCQHAQLVCHGPSAVWLPLWLVLQLVGLQAMPAQPMPAQPAPAPRMQQAPPAQQAPGVEEAPRSPELRPMQRRDAASTPPQQQERPAHSAERRSARPASRAIQPGSDDDDEYGYGVSSEWLKKVKAVEAATKARQQQEKQQQKQAAQPASTVAQGSAQGQQQQVLPAQQDQWVDIEMEDVSAEAVLAAVSQLRGDQEYLDELHRAIDMDWEPVHARPSDDQQAASATGTGADDCSAVDLASAGAGSLLHEQQQQPMGEGLLLVLVLDTNVLVEKKQSLMRCLHQLQHLQQQHAGRIVLQLPRSSAFTQGAGGYSSSSGGSSAVEEHAPAVAAVRLQVVVPWTVLVELDKLKLRQCQHATVAGSSATAPTHHNRLITST